MTKKRTSVIGETYHMLTIIADAPDRNKERRVIVRCECGTIKEVGYYHIKYGDTKACGCHRKKILATSGLKHGMANSSLYVVWDDMRARCNRPSNQSYKNYGAKGVRVCEEWNGSECFPVFAKWALENGWEHGMQLDKDKIPKQLGIPAVLYSPEMCSILTPSENIRLQVRSKRGPYKKKQ